MKIIINLIVFISIACNAICCDTTYFSVKARVLSIELVEGHYLITIENINDKKNYKLFSEQKLASNRNNNKIHEANIYEFCIRREDFINFGSKYRIFGNERMDILVNGVKVLDAYEFPYSAKNLFGLYYILPQINCQ